MVKERVLTPKIHGNLSEVLEILDVIREMAPARAMEEVIARTGYYDYLEKKTKDQSGMGFQKREY